jgi:hypothetical protein
MRRRCAGRRRGGRRRDQPGSWFERTGGRASSELRSPLDRGALPPDVQADCIDGWRAMFVASSTACSPSRVFVAWVVSLRLSFPPSTTKATLCLAHVSSTMRNHQQPVPGHRLTAKRDLVTAIALSVFNGMPSLTPHSLHILYRVCLPSFEFDDLVQSLKQSRMQNSPYFRRSTPPGGGPSNAIEFF